MIFVGCCLTRQVGCSISKLTIGSQESQSGKSESRTFYCELSISCELVVRDAYRATQPVPPVLTFRGDHKPP